MGREKDTEKRLEGGAAKTALIHNPSSVSALGRTISKCVSIRPERSSGCGAAPAN